MGLVENLKFAMQRGRKGDSHRCGHLGMIRVDTALTAECVPCVRSGDTWVHLRWCTTCGVVGCCDSSKNRHASKHAAQCAHPISGSLEPGEDWLWCYVDRAIVERPTTGARR